LELMALTQLYPGLLALTGLILLYLDLTAQALTLLQ
jgi:hypothetical protein